MVLDYDYKCIVMAGHYHTITAPHPNTVLVLKKQHQFSTMDSIHECSCKAGRTTARQKLSIQSGVPHKLFNHQQKISRGNLAQKGRGGMEWVPATPSAPPPANFFCTFLQINEHCFLELLTEFIHVPPHNDKCHSIYTQNNQTVKCIQFISFILA